MSAAAFRILVVDDNSAVQQDFRKIFAAGESRGVRSEAEAILFGGEPTPIADHNFAIDSALQGTEGLAMVQRSLEEANPFALAFVDVRMPPGLDGIETTSRMWKLDPDIQIVICTAYSDYSWKEMLVKLGRSDQLVILKKPFDTIEVLQLASALTAKWRLLREARVNVESLERRVEARTTELSRMATQLKASEAQYRLLFEDNPHPMWVLLTDSMQFVMVNRAATESYGYPAEKFLQMNVRDLYTAEDYAALQRILEARDDHGKHFGLRRHRKADGTIIDVEVSTDELVLDGKPARLVLAHDVTERMRAELKLKGLNRVYSVLSGINTLIVHVKDRGELFQKACDIAVEHGRFRMAFIGVVDSAPDTFTPVASAGATPEFLAEVAKRYASGIAGDETLVGRAVRDGVAAASDDLHADPRVRFKTDSNDLRGSRSVAVLPLSVGGEVVGVLALYSSEVGFFDEAEMHLLTELADNIAFAIGHLQKQERLEYLGHYDALTGLVNRAQFTERVGRRIVRTSAEGGMLALYLIDIERFRDFNETLGRGAGDALLKHIGTVLSQSVEHVFLAARVGIDQFAVVPSKIDRAEDAALVLDALFGVITAHPFAVDGRLYHIAVKAGIALFPNDGLDADEMLKNAEAALTKCKFSADSYLFYMQAMTDAVAGRLAFENRLRLALERNEFVLHYQPKLDFASGTVVGAEALIRWDDPQSGLVPPMQFIPVLEQTGLIQDVGRWALLQAVSDHARWRRAGLRAVPIAVNVSVLQLRRTGFVDEIRRAVVAKDAPAGLEIEITESMIMDDVKQSTATLQAIRDLGVTIAIDDFGTGFSSLSYLSRLPVSALKIDRSFVTEVTKTQEGLALVATIISLGHSLRLKVVAEGVETDEQSDLLKTIGCDEMQGYLLSKPLPRDAFEARFLSLPAGAPLVRDADGAPIPDAVNAGREPVASSQLAAVWESP